MAKLEVTATVFGISSHMLFEIHKGNACSNLDEDHGFVYLISAIDGERLLYKIGCTNDLSRRMDQLREAHEELIPIGAIEVDDKYKIERLLQDTFSHKNDHGEWFDFDAEDLGIFWRVASASGRVVIPNSGNWIGAERRAAPGPPRLREMINNADVIGLSLRAWKERGWTHDQWRGALDILSRLGIVTPSTPRVTSRMLVSAERARKILGNPSPHPTAVEASQIDDHDFNRTVTEQ